jgi:hypothetical protein
MFTKSDIFIVSSIEGCAKCALTYGETNLLHSENFTLLNQKTGATAGKSMLFTPECFTV